jgi:hypothetical protein
MKPSARSLVIAEIASVRSSGPAADTS